MTKRKEKMSPLDWSITSDYLGVHLDDDMTEEERNIRFLLDPAVRQWSGAELYLSGNAGERNQTDCLAALTDQIREVNKGNLRIAEKTLVAQANTLDAVFNNLARMAAVNLTRNLNVGETLLRLALKAQSQCRTTLEALAEIKNPMSGAYVRQANIAAGHQQVNIGVDGGKNIARAGEMENRPNKLSGAHHELSQDIGTPALKGPINPSLEAVGEVYGTKKCGR